MGPCGAGKTTLSFCSSGLDDTCCGVGRDCWRGAPGDSDARRTTHRIPLRRGAGASHGEGTKAGDVPGRHGGSGRPAGGALVGPERTVSMWLNGPESPSNPGRFKLLLEVDAVTVAPG